jgi:hypothetical protein
MTSTIRSNLIARVRGFHQDEAGDTIQAIAVGAVGVLLAAVIFQTMSNLVKSPTGLNGLLSNFLSSLTKGATSSIGF